MTPHPIQRLLELLGLTDDTPPPPTITKLPPLPTATASRRLTTITVSLYGGAKSQPNPPKRRPLPQALTLHMAAVRRLNHRRILLNRPELHQHHQHEATRRLELVEPFTNYITDTNPGGPPAHHPTAADGFGVATAALEELGGIGSSIAAHRMAERWRLEDLTALWGRLSG